MKVKNKGQKQHGCRLVPERVLTLRTLRCGILKQIRDQSLNVVVGSQINEGIVAVALFHVYEIQHLNFIAFILG